MFLRLLFLLLLALNLGAGAWLLFGRAPARALPPATDPGVTELRLLSEHPARLPARAADPSGVAPKTAETCNTLGAFTTSVDMRAAMQALSPHVARIQYREEQVSHSHGFWVYLPATADREGALDEARKLASQLVQGPTFANGITKTMLHQEWAMTIEQAIESEAQAQALCMLTQDFTRAYEAFVARQKPQFEGN